MNFSVLMSLYQRENPRYLAEALESLAGSVVEIDEVLMVIDGPITLALEEVLAAYAGKLPLKLVRLPRNVGLGPALNEGLKACRNDWIARFDTDDVIVKERFKIQADAVAQDPGLDILGSWVLEFGDSVDKPYGLKSVPQTHEEICRYAKSRNPFNHMSVFFRKSKVIEAGAYQDESLYEDYGLWVRMIQAGARTANIASPLVYARAGRAMTDRRGGLKYAVNEYRFQKSFLSAGFISFPRFVMNLATRIPVRLFGSQFRFFVYKNFLRKKQ